jgi:hypothetical protein
MTDTKANSQLLKSTFQNDDGPGLIGALNNIDDDWRTKPMSSARLASIWGFIESGLWSSNAGGRVWSADYSMLDTCNANGKPNCAAALRANGAVPTTQGCAFDVVGVVNTDIKDGYNSDNGQLLIKGLESLPASENWKVDGMSTRRLAVVWGKVESVKWSTGIGGRRWTEGDTILDVCIKNGKSNCEGALRRVGCVTTQGRKQAAKAAEAKALAVEESSATPPPAPEPERAKWSSVKRRTLDRNETSTDIKVAADELANALQGIVSGHIGDIPGILTSLKSATLSFGWGSEKSETKQNLVEFENDTFVQMVLNKEESSKKGSMCFGSARTHTLRVYGELSTMKAENGAARQVCEALMSSNAGDLCTTLTEMHIFKNSPPASGDGEG